MRIRLVIPAALLVAAAYAKGRRDALPAHRAPASACEISEEARLRAEAEAADAREFFGEREVPRPAPVAVVHEEPGAPEPVAPEPVAGTPVHAPAEAAAEVAATLAPPRPVAPPAPVGWEVPEFPFAAGRPRRAAVHPDPRSDARDLASLAEWTAVPAPATLVAAPTPAPEDAPDPDVATLSEWATDVVAAAAPVADPVPAPVVEVRIDAEGRFSLGGWAAQAGHMVLCGVTFRDRLDRPVDVADIRLVPDALANVADGGLVVLGDPGFAPDAEGFTLLVAASGPGAFAATGRYELLAA